MNIIELKNTLEQAILDWHIGIINPETSQEELDRLLDAIAEAKFALDDAEERQESAS